VLRALRPLAGAQFPGAAVYALPTPDDPPTGSRRSSWNRPWKADDGIGHARKSSQRRKQVSRTLARVLATWRTGLSGPVIVLQAGRAVNYFGTGLVLPFEIIYLHQARGFPTATAGLVLAAVMGTATVLTPLSGALLDRFRAKPILITGNLASALFQRAICHRPARGPARNANELGAHRYRRLGRGRDRDRDR
jgi:hypothetical protein